MPSQEAIFLNEMFKNMMAPPPEGQEPAPQGPPPSPELPEGVTLTELDLNGHYGELLTKEGNDGPLVFYIHGGGFCGGAAQERREITFHIAAERGCNVIANNYRLSPEHKWPCHLEDCVEAWQAVLNLGYDPKRIVIMGESAGGTLTLSLPLYLRDHDMPLPAALAAFSPCTDQLELLPSHRGNADKDYILRDGVNNETVLDAVFGLDETGEANRRTSYASPLFADYTGMPPVFLSASDAEALLDDSVLLHKKLTELGHPCEIDIQSGLFHAYPMIPSVPESRETLDKAFAFVLSYIK